MNKKNEIDVRAYRTGSGQWMLEFIDPCPRCNKHHSHGAGNATLPDGVNADGTGDGGYRDPHCPGHHKPFRPDCRKEVWKIADVRMKHLHQCDKKHGRGNFHLNIVTVEPDKFKRGRVPSWTLVSGPERFPNLRFRVSRYYGEPSESPSRDTTDV